MKSEAGFNFKPKQSEARAKEPVDCKTKYSVCRGVSIEISGFYGFLTRRRALSQPGLAVQPHVKSRSHLTLQFSAPG